MIVDFKTYRISIGADAKVSPDFSEKNLDKFGIPITVLHKKTGDFETKFFKEDELVMKLFPNRDKY